MKIAVAGLLLALTVPVALSAQESAKMANKGKSGRTKPKVKAKEDLESLTKISKDSATKVALATVANSSVKSSELEREKGTIVYSFDLTVPGKTGVDEVLVSAIDGHVVAKSHESPKKEKAEAKKEKAEAKKADKKS